MVFCVKIVFAATPEQEEMVNELIQYFYSNIFPFFFSDMEIRQFEQQKVLEYKKGNVEAFDSLGDAYKVIACLQTIISILESFEPQSDYKPIFEKNVSMLAEAGVYFPFTFEHFESEEQIVEIDMFSSYMKPANQYLI